MKITIDENINNEDEIVIRCSSINQKVLDLITMIESLNHTILVNKNDEIIKLDISSILYFESVDKKTFVYTEQDVYEISLRLYEIEDKYNNLDFFRASRSFVVNLHKITSIKSMFGSRLELLLENNEKIIVSRKYIKTLKEILDERRE